MLIFTEPLLGCYEMMPSEAEGAGILRGWDGLFPVHLFFTSISGGVATAGGRTLYPRRFSLHLSNVVF